jgi:hypothetical protein
VVALDEEAAAELDIVGTKLFEYLLPEGGYETMLVDSIATTIWRFRQVLLSEQQTLAHGMNSVLGDKKTNEKLIIDN